MEHDNQLENYFYDDEVNEYVRFLALKHFADIEINEAGEELFCGYGAGMDMYKAIEKESVRFPFKRADYDNAVDIQQTLSLIGLDKEKFWKAILFIHHMWEGRFTDCMPVLDSEKDLLEGFLTDLNTNDTVIGIKRKGKKQESINKRLRDILRKLVSKRLETGKDEDVSFDWGVVDGKKEHRKDYGICWQIYKEYQTYHELFKEFCTDAELPKRVKGQNGLRNKDLLISRIMFLTCLTYNKSYNENVNGLHSVIKKCKDKPEPQTASSHYLV